MDYQRLFSVQIRFSEHQYALFQVSTKKRSNVPFHFDFCTILFSRSLGFPDPTWKLDTIRRLTSDNHFDISEC